MKNTVQSFQMQLVKICPAIYKTNRADKFKKLIWIL